MKLNDYRKAVIKRVRKTLNDQPVFSAEEISQKLGTVRVGSDTQSNPNKEKSIEA